MRLGSLVRVIRELLHEARAPLRAQLELHPLLLGHAFQEGIHIGIQEGLPPDAGKDLGGGLRRRLGPGRPGSGCILTHQGQGQEGEEGDQTHAESSFQD